MTLWKCATKNKLLCNWKSTAGNDINTPVIPPIVKVEIKSKITSLNIFRIGTSGSLQEDIPVNSHVAGTHGLGIDNLLNFYRLEQNEEEKQ